MEFTGERDRAPFPLRSVAKSIVLQHSLFVCLPLWENDRTGNGGGSAFPVFCREKERQTLRFYPTGETVKTT